jgi:hypothetical protein
MAKRSGPVVDTQMPSMGPKSPSKSPAGGQYNHNQAPFDKPKDMGNGGIPEKYFDRSVSPTPARSTTSGSGTPSSNLGGPPSSAKPRGAEKAHAPGNRK